MVKCWHQCPMDTCLVFVCVLRRTNAVKVIKRHSRHQGPLRALLPTFLKLAGQLPHIKESKVSGRISHQSGQRQVTGGQQPLPLIRYTIQNIDIKVQLTYIFFIMQIFLKSIIITCSLSRQFPAGSNIKFLDMHLCTYYQLPVYCIHIYRQLHCNIQMYVDDNLHLVYHKIMVLMQLG